jgi:hypothetical protein
MSRNHLLTFVFLILFGGLSAQTTTNNKPASDATTGYTYNFDKVTELVFKELKGGDKHAKDAEVQQLINTPGFPKIEHNAALNGNDKTAIGNWIQENGSLVIKLFINRKDIVTSF